MKAKQTNTSFITKSSIPIQAKNNNQSNSNNNNLLNSIPFNNNSNNSSNNNQFSFNKPVQKNQQQKKTVDFDAFWNPGAATATKTINTSANNTNQFDQFANFFATSNPKNITPPPQSAPTLNQQTTTSTYSPNIFDYFVD